MTLNQERLQMALMPRPIRFFEQINSTNDAALAWLRDGAPAGAVIIADEQTAGRGRMGRVWYTPSGVALAVSVILHVPPPQLTSVNMAGTLAVCHVLRVMNIPDVAIKWANDVQVRGRKISGILPEAAWEGDQLLGVVLGIGVNVRNDFGGTPLETLATTVEAETSRHQDRAALLAVLLFELDKWLSKLGTPAIAAAYRAHMPMLGQPVTVTGADGELSGIAADVDEHGALLIQQLDGEPVRVFAGDVTVVQAGGLADGH